MDNYEEKQDPAEKTIERLVISMLLTVVSFIVMCVAISTQSPKVAVVAAFAVLIFGAVASFLLGAAIVKGKGGSTPAD